MSTDGGTRAVAAVERLGLAHTVTRHGRVGSLAEAAAAREVTGYEGGTISIGGGEHGVGLTVDAAELLDRLHATVADVTEPVS